MAKKEKKSKPPLFLGFVLSAGLHLFIVITVLFWGVNSHPTIKQSKSITANLVSLPSAVSPGPRGSAGPKIEAPPKPEPKPKIDKPKIEEVKPKPKPKPAPVKVEKPKPKPKPKPEPKPEPKAENIVSLEKEKPKPNPNLTTRNKEMTL